VDQIGDLFFPLSHWSWWVLAAVLIVVEVAAPGVFFLWLGVAAGIVGSVVFFVPDLDWKFQLALFAVLAVVSVALSRRYLKVHPLDTDRPMLNRRGQSYVGRTFTLDQPITDGHGHLRIDDTRWRIAGQDLPVGAKVRVTSATGVTLNVEPLPPVAD